MEFNSNQTWFLILNDDVYSEKNQSPDVKEETSRTVDQKELTAWVISDKIHYQCCGA